jgi:hypothetical protein
MMQDSRRWPDRLSGWGLPPPVALAAGEAEPVRVFDTADAALAFLAANYVSAARSEPSRL